MDEDEDEEERRLLHFRIRWIIIIVVVFSIELWYYHGERGREIVHMFGTDIPVEIAAVVGTGIFLLLSVILTYFLGERRNFKKLLERLGDFKEKSLKSTIIEDIVDKLGVDSATVNLTKQHKQLGAHLATTIKNSVGDVKNSVGDPQQGGSVIFQLQKLLSRADAEEKRQNALSPEQIDAARVVDSLNVLVKQVADANLKNAALAKQLAGLQERIETVESEKSAIVKENNKLKTEVEKLRRAPRGGDAR